MATPIPLLRERLSPRGPCSKICARLSRTFSDISHWDGFLEGSRALFNSLDNTKRAYCKPVYSFLPGKNSMRPAADECEVRGNVVINLLNTVNETAVLLGIPIECDGGGSGRSMSFTDLVVRPAGAETSLADLSSQIFGTGEVKGKWQFQLQRGERLEDALHDPKRIGDVVQAVQQVSADEMSLGPYCICGSCAIRATKCNGAVRTG